MRKWKGVKWTGSGGFVMEVFLSPGMKWDIEALIARDIMRKRPTKVSK